MIWIDFTLLGLVFVFIVLGLFRGFNKEVFSLLFWLLATWVGLTFSHEFCGFWGAFISHQTARIALSFLALLVITLSVGGLINFLISVVTKNSGLTLLNRLGGMLFGVIRGMIFITVVVILAGFTPLPRESWWSASTVLPPFQVLAVWLRDHLSTGIATYISYR